METEMEYEDFEIEIRQSLAGDWEARVLRPTAWRVEAPFTAPFTEASLDVLLEALERRVRKSARDRRELVRPPEAGPPPELPMPPHQLGDTLTSALFTGKLEDVLHQSIGFVRGRGVGLRLRITFDRGQDFGPLAALPWELLRYEDDYLSRRRLAPVVRHLPGPWPAGPLEVEGELRLLVVDSAPIDQRPLDAAEERRKLREALSKHPRLKVDTYEHPSIGGLRDRLLDGGYHVLHFIGHGNFSRESHTDRDGDEGLLYFENEQQLSQPVTGMQLGEYLKDIESLRLVFLNACWSGAFPRRGGQDPYRGVAAALAWQGVPAVVAMQFPISDPAAVTFSDVFYHRLAVGDVVEAAVAEGRLAISEAEPQSLEWVTPVLFLSSENGRLFTSAKSGAAQEAKPTPARERSPFHLGIRSFFARPGAWGALEKDSDHVLDVSDLFVPEPPSNGRYIRAPELWDEEVFPRLRDFLLRHAVPGGRPVVLDFAAHLSLAFAAGYCLEIKSGLDLTIIQRTLNSSFEFRAEAGPAAEGPLWVEEEERRLDPEHPDVALAVGVTHDVLTDVETYIETSGLPIGRLVPMSLDPEPSPTGVRDGLHAMQLAQKLTRKIRQRTAKERKGTLHLFLSAPNAFTFYLGQLAGVFGKVQLYEHDFKGDEPSTYWPSMTFPPRALEVGPRED